MRGNTLGRLRFSVVNNLSTKSRSVMKNICWILVLLVTMILLNAADLFARTVYVTELQEITQRTGPSTENKILKMLPSGVRLTVLEEGDGWLRVQSPDGTTGWVLQRFTTAELPTSLRLERLQGEYDRLREASGGALDRIAELEATNTNLMDSLTETTNNFVALDQKYATLAAEAANVVELRERYERTVLELEEARSRIDALSAENEELRSSERMQWFLFGAGVVFGAWFFGFLTGRMQRRRKTGLQF